MTSIMDQLLAPALGVVARLYADTCVIHGKTVPWVPGQIDDQTVMEEVGYKRVRTCEGEFLLTDVINLPPIEKGTEIAWKDRRWSVRRAQQDGSSVRVEIREVT
jgi:hypothetical protein